MIKHFKRNVAAGAACALGLGLLTAPTVALATEAGTNDAGAAPAAVESGVVNILHFNDFHGRLQAPSGDEGDEENWSGGTVGFAGTIEQLRAPFGDDASLLLSGGDNIGASLYASASQQDTPSLEVLNALEVDAAAVGNHEFDRGIDDLQGRVRDAADFPYLAANVTLDGARIDDGYALFESNGVTVGVIGAVTQETSALVDPSGIDGVLFGDPVEAVNEIAAQLSDGDEANGEADLIIADYHEGSQATLAINAPQEEQAASLEASMAQSEMFRSIVEDTAADVDVIFNGHTHKLYSWLAPAPEGSTQDVRPIVQGGQYAENVSQVVAEVDVATGEVSFPTVQNVARTAEPAAELIAAFPRAAAVDTITDEALEQAEVIGSEPLGEITGDITTAFRDGGRDDRGSASTMGTLVANMLRDQLSSESRGGAEIGITNPGGLRDEFLFEAADGEAGDGVVTVGEAAAVLPFANNLWTTTLTGAQLKLVLEQQWQRTAGGEVPSRAYLQLGLSDNVEYTYDSTLAEGSRITSIWVDGELVAADDTFRVAAPSFLLSGGDNFRGFTAGSGARDSGLVDSEAFEAYIEAQSPISPDFSRRQLEVVGLPTEPVAPGTELSMTVNKIDLTSLGAPVSEQIELYLDDTLLGSFDVVDGSATVELTVPIASAQSAFELRTAAGTAIALPLAVDFAVDRIAGDNRFETSVEISQSHYGQGAEVVYVASGQVWPDALTAAPAAATEGGPLLLVPKAEAPQVVLDEIARLGAERVVIVGGEPSVSAAVESAIADIETVSDVTRLGGVNRFETSRMVADYAFESAEGAYVVTGSRFPDALSAGAAAGHLEWPLMLVDTRVEIPSETVALLDDLEVERVRVIGDTNAVPSAQAGELVDAGFVVSRQAGSNRFITSAIVTRAAFDSAEAGAYLASGVLFPDALSGGAVAGAQGAPLLITRPGCIDASVLSALESLSATSVTLLGGTPSLSEEVAALTRCS
ncbi:cell wall-binding repeat-containing protein [Agrococcus sp. Marseille-P2731]|uniref:cell wall-binding repeat-containing protein n=1 Tax=Agrococcus sp. Marseille-P2731 TaxID=1841862 RepID=UPI0009314A27|nr:cell wall-binding repeat-containing protein [Agrococcus sp. Marseille-P2731]